MTRDASSNHADGLGSIIALTDVNGNSAASYTYDSFGNLTASTGTVTNPYRYTAREFDTETGIYNCRARYYLQGIGRFASEDPSDQGTSYDALNLRVYAENSPTNSVDPLLLLAGCVDLGYGPSGMSVSSHKPLREIADPKEQGSAPASEFPKARPEIGPFFISRLIRLSIL